MDSFFDLCEDRSPGYGQRSVAWLRVGLQSGWIGALGRGFKLKTSFPGAGRLSLSANPNFVVVLNFDGNPYMPQILVFCEPSVSVIVKQEFK